MRYRNLLCMVSVFVFSSAASAQGNDHSHKHTEHHHTGHGHTEHRHHGAHTHGVAEVTLAAIDGEVMVTLQVPAGDILGFERKPADDQEEQHIRQQLSWLESAQWLSLGSTAACQLMESHAHTELLNDDHAGHADIHAELIWQCKNSPQLTDINVFLFTNYKALVEVQVDWILETRSGRVTLLPGSSSLSGR